MKKIGLLLWVMVLCLVFTSCGGGQDTTSGSENNVPSSDAGSSQSMEENQGTKDNTTLIVGTEAGYAPFEYIGKGGEIVGVDIDIVAEIAKRAGKELVVKNMSFDGALAAVESGKVDLVAAAVTITPERAEKMDFSESYVESEQVIVVSKANPGIPSTDPKDMEGKIAGVQLGTTGDLWVSDSANATPASIKKYTQFAQGAMDLKNGKIDFMIMDVLPAKELVASTGEDFMIVEGEPVVLEKTALALPKGSDELMKIVNETILDLKKEGKIEQFIQAHTNQE